ncbi:MAG: sigma 54-interacting transcriptional regulator [Planctomycetales bacterium]|nr:sigma 54-interacting transcriptional regulator [Planctomycetales bacterium]
MTRPRSLTTQLRRVLDSLHRVVAVVDSDGVVNYANRACTDWLAIAAEDLLGAECRYHTSTEVGSPLAAAAALCPPPQASEGRLVSSTVSAPRPGGEVEKRCLVFLPLTDGEETPQATLIVEQSAEISYVLAYAASGQVTTELHDALQQMQAELSHPFRLERFVGTSVATRRLRDQLVVAVQTDCNVLVVGPPGSRRGDVARCVHYGSRVEAQDRLLPLACALVDAETIESTLESFSRAEVPRATLLLEDVDHLAPDGQAVLARALTGRHKFRRVVATARRDLMALVEAGTFRADLASSIDTLTIALTALRQRPADVPYLAQLFLEEENARGRRQLSGFSPEALDCLAAYAWPGDVTELSALIARLYADAETTTVRSRDLPSHVRTPGGRSTDAAGDVPIVLDDFLAGIELELIQRALIRAGGNKAQAARLLGMTRPRLYRRLVQLGIDTPGDGSTDTADDDASETPRFESPPQTS